MHRIALSFVLVVLVSGNLSAQIAQPSPPSSAPPSQSTRKPIRDQQALTVIQAALNALGGATAIAKVTTWQAQGEVQVTKPDGTNISGTFNWEEAGTQIRMDGSFGPVSAYITTGNGNPAVVTNGNSIKVPDHVANNLFIPALAPLILLKEFQRDSYGVHYVGTKTLGSENVTVVMTATATPKIPNSRLTSQTWYFDNTTHLPVRVEFRMPAEQTPLVSASGAANFSNFQPIAGVLYPFQVVNYLQGKQTTVATLQSVNANPSIPSTDFDAPTPTGGAR